MKLTIRIYRTHDFDLMALYQTGAISLASAMKKAIIAYYNGEYFKFAIQKTENPDPASMPLVRSFILNISNQDSPGIEEWIAGIMKGYRNCCIKAILRHYLEDPCMAFFREDGHRHDLIAISDEPIILQKKKRKVKEKTMTSQEWLESIYNENTNRHDPDPLLTVETHEQETDDKESVFDQNNLIEEKIESGTEVLKPEEDIEEEAEFDAFAAFESMM